MSNNKSCQKKCLQSKIQKAINFMEKKFENRLLMKEIACIICLSPRHFWREFKGLTKVSPNRYLNQIRIEKAKKMIAERKDVTLTKVAFSVGFESSTHFTRTFKTFCGQTPFEYRKSVSKEKGEYYNGPQNLDSI